MCHVQGDVSCNPTLRMNNHKKMLSRFFSLLMGLLFAFQVGYDKQGLPIGLQLIGRPWAEATILRLASAVEV